MAGPRLLWVVCSRPLPQKHVMVRFLAMRLRFHLQALLAMAAVLAGSSNASVACAHAISHAREAHQTSDHHHIPSHHADPDEVPSFHPSDSHGHTVLQIASAKRIDRDLIGPAVPAVAVLASLVDTKHGSTPAARTEAAIDRATGPPPQTRAPPLL